jgi:putative hemolysin
MKPSTKLSQQLSQYKNEHPSDVYSAVRHPSAQNPKRRKGSVNSDSAVDYCIKKGGTPVEKKASQGK